MLRTLIIASLAAASIAPVDVFAAPHTQYTNVVVQRRVVRRTVVVHRNHPHRKTIKRVGIGAAGGAAVGALLGGGAGAGIGALAGGGAGAIYDHHEKSRGR